MIETPPHIENITSTDIANLDKAVLDDINKLLDRYTYWSEVKYKKISGDKTPSEVWSILKYLRSNKSIEVYAPYGLHFCLTSTMMRLCHVFDMKFGGSWGSESILPHENRKRYLVGSIIEEAISSSQMEGASTTRKIAKEMLRKNISPKDKSQRMIYNNYQTINYLSEHTNQPLSIDFILEIHSLMTDSTLDNPDDSGRFRSNDEVVVENAITHEVVHTPPSNTEIHKAMEWLVSFANEEDTTTFIHPIIKAIIIHFFISYLHPFVDGNGRTARALFYWYMLKSGYWLTEYMSISRVIYKSKASYEKSFLQTEADNNDIGYFISYHLKALEKAFSELQKYISLKIAQQNDQNRLLRIGNISQRQSEILYMLLKDENTVLTIKDVTSKLLITPTTAKHDVTGLMEMGLISEIPLNRQKRGYVRGPRYKEKIENLL
ncbi:MAG: Fic family protein [Pseudoflavonifractor sp.]|nr:Fic family protein [Pseudoflavonifractor sp.]